MPRGTQLSDFERGQILALHSTGKSHREIAGAVKRSKGVVTAFLKNPENYGQKKRSGRPKLLSNRDERAIHRLVSNTPKSCSEVKSELNLAASRWTINRAINRSPNLQYRKLLRAPPLTTAHKLARLQWAREHMTWTEEWKTVLFSDEKKFNLDGPDGLAYYWHDLRKEEQYFSQRVHGGGSVMIWAAFGWNGTTPVAFILNRMNAAAYQDMLEQHILPFGRLLGGPNWIFQQDNAPIHNARTTRQWFLDQNIRTMTWPAKSPDLNPIENLWGILVRRVYRQNRQFQSENELMRAIEEAWVELPLETLQNLINSMSNRIYEVICRQGRNIRY